MIAQELNLPPLGLQFLFSINILFELALMLIFDFQNSFIP
jgi:hypothetical protein